MNTPESQITDEMLSAYVDGELTQAETEHVVAALEQSESLRRSLAELKQIRLEIQQLPQHSLTANFTSNVMARCEPAPIGAGIVSAKPRAQASSKVRLITTIAASAAAILIGLYAIGPGGSGIPFFAKQPRSTAQNKAPAAGAEMSDSQQEELLVERSEPQAEQDNALSEMQPLGSSVPGAAGDEGTAESSQGSDQGRARNLFSYQVSPLADNAAVPVHALVRASLAPHVPALSSPQWLPYQSGGRLQTSELRAASQEDALVRAKETNTPNAKTLIIEGTRAEIEAAFQELTVSPGGITLLDSNLDAASLGLPTIDALSASGPTSMQRATAPLQIASDARSQRDGAAAAQLRLRQERRQQRAPAEESPRGLNEAAEFKKSSADAEESPSPRFRVVLILEEQAVSEQP